MIIMTGTIRENVQIAQMSKWIEEKKTKGFVKEKEMTEEERMIEFYKEQLEQTRESDKYNSLSTKIQSGAVLTSEEITYLEQKNPQLLKTYREIQMEKKSYERQLRNCKTKEEVERLKVNKVNGYLVEARSIANNPNIPKSAKKAAMEVIMAKLTNIQKAHYKFVKSPQYQELAEEDEMAKERTKLADERQEASTELVKNAGESEETVTQETQDVLQTGATEVEKEADISDKGQENTEAEDVLTFIQAALTRLGENSYTSGGDTIPADLEYKTGKRLDIKG